MTEDQLPAADMSSHVQVGKRVNRAAGESEFGPMDYRLLGNRKVRRALRHFITKMRIIGREPLVLPVLWVRDPHSGERQLVEPLLDYLVDNDAQSPAWHLNVVRAVGMLFDFIWQSETELAEFKIRRPNGDPYLWLLRDLARSIHRGTLRYFEGKSEDRRGLWWPARSSNSAKQLVGGLVRFLDWYGEESESNHWKKLRLDDAVLLKRMGPLKLAFCIRVRRKTSFYGHIKKTPKAPSYSALMNDEGGTTFASAVYAFPEQYIWPFIADGFRSGADGQELDVVAMLVAILCIFGGLRKSEPMHLFVGDFALRDGKPVVALRHPVHSMIKYRGTLVTRRSFLNQEFNSYPRTMLHGAQKAGWKGIAGDLSNAIVHFLPVPGIEDFFSAYLVHYLTTIRPKLVAAGGPATRNPYLFLSSGKQWGNSRAVIGTPYTIAAFVGAWQRAFRRIAMKFGDPVLVYGKEYGTTPHGGRHFFGRFLEEHSGDSRLIMDSMHHLSPFSQLVYTQASPEKINARMQAGWSTAGQGQHRTHFDALESQIRGWKWRPWHAG